MNDVLLGVEVLVLVLMVWALVEAIRARSWRWVLTIALLSGVGALAWFVGARRQYT